MVLFVGLLIVFLGSVQTELIIFDVNILPYLLHPLGIFEGSLLTLVLGFITPRIDKKLQILSKNYFLPLLKILYYYQPEYLIDRIEDVKEIREELVKHGKYFGVPCYPRKLLVDMNEFLELAEEHNNLLKNLQEISKKRIGMSNLKMLNSLMSLTDINLDEYEKDVVKKHESVSNHVRQEQPELLEKIKISYEEMKDIHVIIENFEGFLRDNSIEWDFKPPPSNGISISFGKVSK